MSEKGEAGERLGCGGRFSVSSARADRMANLTDGAKDDQNEREGDERLNFSLSLSLPHQVIQLNKWY